MSASVAGVAIWRWLLVVVGVVLLVVALVTGSSTPAKTVASVDGTKITLATYNTWLKSSAKAANSSSKQVPPFVPDAPGYIKCIQFIAAAQKKSGKSPSNTTLLTDCKQLRQNLAEEVMQLLISSEWILHEGQLEGIKVTDAQVNTAVHSQFAKNATGLTQFLNSNGLSQDELQFEARVSLTAQRLSQRHVGSPPNITQAQIQQFYDTNKAQLGGKTLAQLSAQIKQELIAESEAPKVETYLSTVQKRYLPRTTCAVGYRIAGYCKHPA